MAFVTNTYTASFSAYEIVPETGEEIDYGWIVCISVIPKATAVLGLATVTLRWNDGAARSRSVLCALTTLGSIGQDVFPIVQAPGTNVTLEATMVGSGAQFNVGFGIAS